MSLLQNKKPLKKGRGQGILARIPNKVIGSQKSASNQSPSLGNKDVEDAKPSNYIDASNNNIQKSNSNEKKEVVLSGSIDSQNPVNSHNTNSKSANLIAKYNYKANIGRPGGFDELSLKQSENLTLIRKGHQETNNMLWWEVRNEGGEQGFVPANYCMVLEEKLTALPWLETKRIQDEKEEQKRLATVEVEKKNRGNIGFGAPENYTAPVKQYISAYSVGETPQNSAMAKKEYYCDICDKNLNGPTPYKMHMSSKAHREEVEYQNSKN